MRRLKIHTLFCSCKKGALPLLFFQARVVASIYIGICRFLRFCTIHIELTAYNIVHFPTFRHCFDWYRSLIEVPKVEREISCHLLESSCLELVLTLQEQL